MTVVVDELFTPSLGVVADKMGFGPEVAGATVMAVGSSTPDLLTAVVGVLHPEPFDDGIVEIMASAVFKILCIIGICGLVAPSPVQISWYPLVRDSAFYSAYLLVLLLFFWDAKIKFWEGLVMLSGYIVFVIFIRATAGMQESVEMSNTDAEFDKLDANRDGRISRAEAAADEDNHLLRFFSRADANQNGGVDSVEFFRWRRRKKVVLRARRNMSLDVNGRPIEPAPLTLKPPQGKAIADWVYYTFAFPILLALFITVPDFRRPGFWKRLYVLQFVGASIWILILAMALVEQSKVLELWTGMEADKLVMVATFLPELIACVLVTAQGYGHMATSASIGANVFEVTIGLPLPWVVLCRYRGRDVAVKSAPLTLMLCVGSMILMVVLMLVSFKLNTWRLTRALGAFFLFLLAVFIVAITFISMLEGMW